jgi:ketosteroid isomerase-like protein
MSQENVEVVRSLYRAINDRDTERAAEFADSELEWIPDSRVGVGPIRGRANVLDFFNDRAEMFDEFRVEVERFWDRDDRVLVFLRHTGRGHGSGAEFDIRIGHLWIFRDGVVVRGEGYADRAEALKAAGLEE